VTIIPFAAAVCHDCKAPVAIVRRTVEVPCESDEVRECRGHGAKLGINPCLCHTHAIPDVGPPTLVEEDGIRHECATLTGVA
jgi:hypothetical protein